MKTAMVRMSDTRVASSAGARTSARREVPAVQPKYGVGAPCLWGRSQLEIRRIPCLVRAKQVTVPSVKDGLEFGDTLTAEALAFAFGLAAEIERALIDARSQENFG